MSNLSTIEANSDPQYDTNSQAHQPVSQRQVDYIRYLLPWKVSHLDPDILEYEVKWALRSTAVNKASGCDEISAGLFRFLKDDTFKVLH